MTARPRGKRIEKREKETRKGWVNRLKKLGVPQVLIPGLVMALILGWAGWEKMEQAFGDYKAIFSKNGRVVKVTDGDTFTIHNGMVVRMIGIDAPNVNGEGKAARNELAKLIERKQVWLEYDRYQDDKFGRLLAWVWVGCERAPDFLPADYMHKSGNESNPGLAYNPDGCTKGKLVQEELVRQGLAEVEVYKDRGELKYEKRLLQAAD